MSKVEKDIRLPYEKCKGMTVREIRRTKEYKALTPLGVKNPSGAYRFGNKSTMNKEELCKALDNPTAYHKKIKKLISQKKNAGPRKRSTRKGLCLAPKRKVPCSDPAFPHKGVTTTGKACCYKNKQSEKTMNKRLKAAGKTKRRSSKRRS
jgi:hypothetical protein